MKIYIYFVSYFVTEEQGFTFGSAEVVCKHKIRSFEDISGIAETIRKGDISSKSIAIIGYHFLRIENE